MRNVTGLIVIVTLLSCSTLYAANGNLLRNDTGLYPRAIRLAHNGSSNGRVLASVVTFSQNNGLGVIYESSDGGSSFYQVGTVADPEAGAGRGLCCATLYELPQQVGSLPAGTLLWAASVGQSVSNRRMAIRIWSSNDRGRSWTYLSSAAVAPNTRGLWEPEFSIAADGRLVCHYSDETDPSHSQKLVRVRSSDGFNWTDYSHTVASNLQSDRPGMSVVRKLPNNTYIMSYEICAPSGQYSCVAHYRTSPNGWDWGTPSYLGIRPETVDGKYFKHAPTIAWSPSPSPNGKLLLIGQVLYNRNGTVASGNGGAIFANTENGAGFWYEIAAPVRVFNPYDNYCPNYSSTLLPASNGSTVLEIASDYDGGVCKPYFASGSLNGTGSASGVENGATYRLVSVQSKLCLDVAGGATQPADVWQWTCNNLPPQNWLVTSVGNDFFTLKAQNSGLCLDVDGDSRIAGGDVRQWYCNNLGPQNWRIVNVGLGYYKLIGQNSGMCLDVAGGSKQPGANVQQWQCNNLAPQIWKFERR